MTDLAVLAVGFGSIPLAAILLYSFRDGIGARQGLAWGVLAGVLAFLGLSHAMALVLERKPFLFGGSSSVVTVLFLGVALGLGAALAYFVLEGPRARGEPSRIVWAAATFLALHSFGDGMVLGRGFAGAIEPLVPIDPLTIASTIFHRFLEGAFVIVPALASAWRARSSFTLLLAGVAVIPGAYAPSFLADSQGFVAGGATASALSAFLAATEATFALILLLRGFLPVATAKGGPRWTLWTAVGFTGISVLHFLVE